MTTSMDIHASPISMSDDCLADLNFDWLFDPERHDHLPMEEQLQLYKRRDLLPGKLYRTAAKIWGPAKSRVRWIDCHTGLNGKNIKGQSLRFEDTHTRGHEYFDSNLSDRLLRSTNRIKLLATDENTKMTEKDSNNIDTLRVWLEERRNLRNDLDSIGLSDENWLRDKPNKTAMERRVLARLIAESHPNVLETSTLENDSLNDLKDTKSLPALKRPSPEAIRIIERLLYERQMRLVDLFRIIDKDNNWRLTRDEFRRAVRACGLPLEDTHIDELISMFGESPTFELDYRDMALSMNVWKHEKIETKKKKLNSAGAVVQTDELRRMTDTDKINGSHGNNTVEDASGKLPGSEGNRRARTTSGYRSESQNMSSSEMGMKGNNKEKVILLSAKRPNVAVLSRNKQTLRTKDSKSDVHRQLKYNSQQPLASDAVVNVVLTGDKAIDDHCSPSTLGGSTGEAVNHFRQDTLKEYLEIGRLCSENGLPFSVPVLQKALLYYADKQRDQITEELRRSSNSHPRDKTQRSGGRPNARLAPIGSTQSGITSGGKGYSTRVGGAGNQGFPASSSSRDKLPLRLHGSVLTNERHTNDFTDGGGIINGTADRMLLLDASCNGILSRERLDVISEGNYRKRSPRRDGVEPKVDCWMTFEEYSKFRSGEEQTKRRRARAAVSPGRSGNILDKMRLWMPNKDDDNGNALFSRISRPTLRRECYGGGLAAWQINQSGYIQYGTIEK